MMTAPGAQSSSMFLMSFSETWPCEGMLGLGRQGRFAHLVVCCGWLAHLGHFNTEPGFRWSLGQPLGIELSRLYSLYGFLPFAQRGVVRIIEESLDLVAEILEASGIGCDVEEDRQKSAAERRQRLTRAVALSSEASGVYTFHPDLALLHH